MTALINTIVGAASTAVDRVAGALSGKGGESTAGMTGEFASLLSNMTGAATVATAGRGRELRTLTAEGGEALALEVAAEGEGEEGEGTSIPTSMLMAARAKPENGPLVKGAEIAVDGVEGAAAEEAEPELDLDLEIDLDHLETAASAEVEDAADVKMADLNPEFRRRLERVIERMEKEFGHEVNIVEGNRSQARQNFLYEQGRTRPGPVVTWTRNSNHTVGRAVDVMIDGTYNNAQGYQRLARIAAEEGLRTLGPRDAGHIELPAAMDGLRSDPQIASALGIQQAAETPADSDLPRQIGGIARVAEVAKVAEVAQVAQVARVAEVARVARVSDPTRPVSVDGIRPNAPVQTNPVAGLAQSTPNIDAAAHAANGLAAAAAGGSGNPSAGGEGKSGKGGERGSEQQLQSVADILAGDPGLGRGAFSTGSVREGQAVNGADPLQRVADILAMKDSAEAGPINHMLLRVDSPDGGQDRIRVDLRGLNVDTTLNIGDANKADELASRIGDLRQSLERHGLEADAVRIRSNPSTMSTDRVEMARNVLAAAEAEAARGGSNARNQDGGGTSRDPWRGTEEQNRRDSDTNTRQRSRREQRKEKQS